MSWSALTPEVIHMKGREPVSLKNFSDEDSQALFIDLAKEQLRSDIARELQSSKTDDVLFDYIAENDNVKPALSFLMLALHFESCNNGADTLTDTKAKLYRKKYTDETRLFKTFGESPASSSTSSNTLWR